MLDRAIENVYEKNRWGKSIGDVSRKPSNNVVCLDRARTDAYRNGGLSESIGGISREPDDNVVRLDDYR